MQEATEESPLRRSEAMSRQQHAAPRVDAEAGHAHEESLVRDGHEPALPAHRERVEQQRERAHEHRRTCLLYTSDAADE